MPKLPINYKNTIIYKIVCKDLEIKNCYVGHTTNWIKRKSKHKKNCKSGTAYVYQFIRENGNWENWQMIMIEKIECDDFISASAKEREWIENLNADLNMISPATGLTRIEYLSQYRIINTEKIKKYYTENSEKINEKVKQWNSENSEQRKSYMKQYASENAEKLREYNKNRYAKMKLQKNSDVS